MASRILTSKQIKALFDQAMDKYGYDGRAYKYDAELMSVVVYAVGEDSMQTLSFWCGDSHPASARRAGQMEFSF
jgi:hypothetical protein